MKRWMSLAETAKRLGVSRRTVWETMLQFSPLIRAVVGAHGKLEFENETVERLSYVFSARRRGWIDPEIRDWLHQQQAEAIRGPETAPQTGSDPAGLPVTAGQEAPPAALDRFLELALAPILRQIEDLRHELRTLKEA